MWHPPPVGYRRGTLDLVQRGWGWLASRQIRGAYAILIAVYLAGALLWLALGVVPVLADAIGPFHRGLGSLAVGGGPLAAPAARVLEHSSSLQHGAWVGVQYLFSALNVALGVLLTLRRRHDPVPRLLALAFIGTACTFNAPSHTVFHILGGALLVTAVHFTFHVVSGVAYLWAVLLFPDGHLPALTARGRQRAAFAATASTAAVAFVCWRSSFIAHPPFFVAFFGVLVPLVGIGAQTWRMHRQTLHPAQWQQARLLRLALTPALALAGLWLAAQAVPSSTITARLSAGVESFFPAVFAVVPVVLFVAILRYRLWDIDVLLSRTLLVGLLGAVVALVYGGVLLVTGSVVGTHGWAAVVAMGIVAVVVEPVRQRCRRFANRVVFGQELTPREAMQALVDRLRDPSPDDGLAELTRLIVAGTRCTGAEVWLVLVDHLLLAAATGTGVPAGRTRPIAAPTLAPGASALPDRQCLPVSHEGRLQALLALTVPAGVSLPAAEQRLVADLAGHAGLLVANAQLTADLTRQVDVVTTRAEQVRRSRERVVLAQDLERRRLERDIHDGAQQQLVALMIGLGTVRRGWTQGTGSAGQAAQLRALLADTTGTLRELAAGRAPVVLREHGLAAALTAAAGAAQGTGLAASVRCPPDRLPLQIETAAYFCCLEALQNALKHAGAHHAVVEVGVSADSVRCSVSDDGTGFDPSATPGGSGLRNLAARLAAHGGTLQVHSAAGAGTRVDFAIPLVIDLAGPAQAAHPAAAVSG